MNERGTVTLWMVGLALCLLVLGWLAVDLARAVAARQALASAADATVAVATDGDAVRVVATATVGLSLLRLVRGAAPFSLRVTAVARPHRVP